MKTIDIDGFDFTLLKDKEDYVTWRGNICSSIEVSLPDKFPCLANNIIDSERYDVQMYLSLGDLVDAVNLLKELA